MAHTRRAPRPRATPPRPRRGITLKLPRRRFLPLKPSARRLRRSRAAPEKITNEARRLRRRTR